MKKALGYTLIELISVIVILGILAVTAAPKFLNIQSDARVALLKGLQAAIKTADAQVYAKAALQGVESLPETVINLPGGVTVQVNYGHADTHAVNVNEAGIVTGDKNSSNSLVDGLGGLAFALSDNGEWVLLNSGTNIGIQEIVLAPHGVHDLSDFSNRLATNCTLTYRVFNTEIKDPEFILDDNC